MPISHKHAWKTASLLVWTLCTLAATSYGQDYTFTSAAFPQVFASSVAWGDYDNDGFLDFVVIGSRDSVNDTVLNVKANVASIFHNNGDGTFTENTAAHLMPVCIGNVAWGDYDNDGYLDLLYGGVDTNSQQVTKLYHNNGNGTFTENTLTNFHSSSYGSVAWGDYNNDGYLDILVTGVDITPGVLETAKLYRNNKDGTFTEVTTAGLQGVNALSKISFGDYDNDGYQDILLCGRTTRDLTNPQSVTKLYHNNRGDGTFTEDTAAHFQPVARGQVLFGDFNNDGYLDVFVAGVYGPLSVPPPGDVTDTAMVYLNQNGTGRFTPVHPGTMHVMYATAAVGDYDGDGILDLVINGYREEKHLYKGNGDGTFTARTIPLPQLGEGGVALGDYNADGYLDMLASGTQVGVPRDSTLLLRNSVTGTSSTVPFAPNTAPSAPTNMKAAVNGSSVTLSWGRGTDSKTPGRGLSYALRVGSASNGIDVVAPLAGPTGKRRVAALGLQNLDTAWTLKSLANGTYYWSVQAIDNGYQGSPFTTEGTFTISGTGIASYTPRQLNFGSVTVGHSKKDSIKVRNTGTGPVKIVKTPLTGLVDTSFAVTPDSATIAAGDSTKIFVTFKPTFGGGYNTKLIYTANGATKDTLLLSGVGTGAGVLLVTPKTLAFDTVLVLTSKRDSVKVKNISGPTVLVGAGRWDTSFTVTPDTVTLKAGDSVYFKVTWRPTAAGPVNTGMDLGSSIRIDTLYSPIGVDSVAFTGFGKLMTLSQVRKTPTGTPVSFQATVSRARGRYTYVQDTAAGLTIFQSSGSLRDSVASGYVKKGDRLILSGKTTQFNNLLEISGASSLTGWVRLSRGDTATIQPLPITLKQLKTGGDLYESRLVKVSQVQLVGNTDTLIKAGKSYSVKDPSDTAAGVVLYTASASNAGDSQVDSTAIPGGTSTKHWVFTFTGPIGQFSSSDSTKGYELMAVDLGDVRFDSLVTAIAAPMADGAALPRQFRLEQNYPNPFNPSTTIEFALPKQAPVEVKVYNTLGQAVATLVQGTLPAGVHQVQFQAGNLASGLYFYRIQAGPFTSVKKMMLVK